MPPFGFIFSCSTPIIFEFLSSSNFPLPSYATILLLFEQGKLQTNGMCWFLSRGDITVGLKGVFKTILFKILF